MFEDLPLSVTLSHKGGLLHLRPRQLSFEVRNPMNSGRVRTKTDGSIGVCPDPPPTQVNRVGATS